MTESTGQLSKLRRANLLMIQSSAMRTVCLLLLLGLGAGLPGLAAEHVQPPVVPATTFAAYETHADEKVTIAVEPYDTREKESIFRIEYTKYNVMPVRFIVTNDGDKPISLRSARILFETAAGDRVQAAEPEDVERLLDPHERPSTLPLPGPIPGIKLKPKNKNKDVEDDFNTFEYGSLVVEAHTTRAGFLFYVVPITNPLKGADMYIDRLKGADGQTLFSFQIPFEKYLKGKSGN